MPSLHHSVLFPIAAKICADCALAERNANMEDVASSMSARRRVNLEGPAD